MSKYKNHSIASSLGAHLLITTYQMECPLVGKMCNPSIYLFSVTIYPALKVPSVPKPVPTILERKWIKS